MKSSLSTLHPAESLKNQEGDKLGYPPATSHYLSPSRTSPFFTINDSHHQRSGIQQWNVSRFHPEHPTMDKTQ
jgi:hypothetical protein